MGVSLGLLPIARAQSIYLSGVAGDAIKFVRMDLSDGTVSDVIVDDDVYAKDVAFDALNRRVYWTELGEGGSLVRARWDGSQRETLLSGLGTLYGVAVDGAGGKLYWSEWGNSRIRRGDLDGSNAETIATFPTYGAIHLALDPAAGKIYWTDWTRDKVQRANLDGTNVEDVYTGIVSDVPVGIAVDPAGGKVYWADKSRRRIRRVNLDGTGPEDLNITGLVVPIDVDIDPAGGKLYCTDDGGPVKRVLRADLDGSGAEEIVAEAEYSFVWGVAVDSVRGRVYWANYGRHTIGSADLDGRNIGAVADNTIGLPYGLQIDTRNDKMYWVDNVEFSPHHVVRSNLDGTQMEVLVDTFYGKARSLALDRISGHVYWADSNYASGGFWRCNLDGTDAVTLAEHWSDWPLNVEFDTSTGKLYWPGMAYYGGAGMHIWRSNPDTSGIEELVVSRLLPPQYIVEECSGGFALDSLEHVVYWTEGYGDHNGRIKRVDVRGAKPEELFYGPLCAKDLVLDQPAGKMYWTATFDGTVFRANLDGTEIETLPESGLSRIYGIALEFRTIPGDCARNGRIDVRDAAHLTACLDGPHAALQVGCACDDWDGSERVDLIDFGLLQNSFGAAGP